MKQEKKRNRTCRKYHFDTIVICRETDLIFTKCRICKEYYPSTLEYFRKDSDPQAKRIIQPLCNECARKIEKQKREIEKIKKIEEQKPLNVEEQPLFEEEQEETMESKIDKIFNFL